MVLSMLCPRNRVESARAGPSTTSVLNGRMIFQGGVEASFERDRDTLNSLLHGAVQRVTRESLMVLNAHDYQFERMTEHERVVSGQDYMVNNHSRIQE